MAGVWSAVRNGPPWRRGIMIRSVALSAHERTTVYGTWVRAGRTERRPTFDATSSAEARSACEPSRWISPIASLAEVFAKLCYPRAARADGAIVPRRPRHSLMHVVALPDASLRLHLRQLEPRSVQGLRHW